LGMEQAQMIRFERDGSNVLMIDFYDHLLKTWRFSSVEEAELVISKLKATLRACGRGANLGNS
jgi:hypothetical protein